MNKPMNQNDETMNTDDVSMEADETTQALIDKMGIQMDTDSISMETDETESGDIKPNDMPMEIGEPMESHIKEMVSKLPEERQAVFWVKYDSEKKNPTTAALLCFFLGGFGAHRFYLGQIQLGIGYFIGTLALFALPVYIAFVEAFFAPGYTRKLNEQKAMRLLQMLGDTTVVFIQQ